VAANIRADTIGRNTYAAIRDAGNAQGASTTKPAIETSAKMPFHARSPKRATWRLRQSSARGMHAEEQDEPWKSAST
jgi:hypothetical protein